MHDNAITTAGLMTLSFSDWDHSRTATMDVPLQASVAEAIDEAKHELELPTDVPYLALYNDEQLDGLSSLQDSRIEPGGHVELMPDVKAG